ncbi:hypothetical protein EV2_029169 [Malus domestica]
MNPISYRVKVRTLYKLVIHVKENMMPNMQYLQHSGVSEKPWIPSNLDVKGCQVAWSFKGGPCENSGF